MNAPKDEDLMPKYRKQAAEWQTVKDELIDAGKNPSAHDVTSELVRRMTARGERYMEYDDIVKEYEENKAKHQGVAAERSRRTDDGTYPDVGEDQLKREERAKLVEEFRGVASTDPSLSPLLPSYEYAARSAYEASGGPLPWDHLSTDAKERWARIAFSAVRDFPAPVHGKLELFLGSGPMPIARFFFADATRESIHAKCVELEEWILGTVGNTRRT